MEDVKGLRDVLERIERKLVVVRYIHEALAFAYWSTALALFYVLLSIVRVDLPTTIAFWLSATVKYYPVWSRTKKILGLNVRAFLLKKLIPLVIIFSICLWLPCHLMKFTNFEHAVGVAILCSVSLYILTLALTIRAKTGKFPSELVPSILTFTFAPAVLAAGNPLILTGFAIVLTYGLTTLTCLFKAISVVE